MPDKRHPPTRPEEPTTRPDTPSGVARARPRTHIRPRPVDPATDPPQSVEDELADVKGHVLWLDGFVRDQVRSLEDVRSRLDEHLHAHTLPSYRSELPSETSLSLHPMKWRVTLKNWAPTPWVLALLIVAGVVVVWLLRH